MNKQKFFEELKKGALTPLDWIVFGAMVYFIVGSLIVMWDYGVLARFSIIHSASYGYAPHAYKLVIFGLLYLLYLRPTFKLRAPFFFMFFYGANEVIYNAVWFAVYHGFPNYQWYITNTIFIGATLIGAYVSRPVVVTKVFKSLGWYTIPLVAYFGFWVFDVATGLPSIPVAPWDTLSHWNQILNVDEFLGVVNLTLLVPFLFKSESK